MVRIVLADDHPLFREGLRRLLEETPGLRVCAEAGNPAETVAHVRQLKPDVLLLDYNMPDRTGLEVLRLLSDEATETRVLLVTAAISRGAAVQALQLGARGLIQKTAGADGLVQGIAAVMSGSYWMEETVADLDACLRRLLASERAGASRFNLTPRERDIVRELADGLSNRELAERFDVSEITVKHHLKSIFDKCGTSNRVELVLFALRHGLARL